MQRIALLLLIVVAFVACKSEEEKQREQALEDLKEMKEEIREEFPGLAARLDQTPVPEEPYEIPRLKSGDVFDYKDAGIILTTVEQRGFHMVERPFESVRCYMIKVQIVNNGEMALGYNHREFTLKDKDGFTYESSYSLNQDVKQGLREGSIPPGGKVTGYVAFNEVPEGSGPYSVTFAQSGQILAVWSEPEQ